MTDKANLPDPRDDINTLISNLEELTAQLEHEAYQDISRLRVTARQIENQLYIISGHVRALNDAAKHLSGVLNSHYLQDEIEHAADRQQYADDVRFHSRELR